MKQLASCKFCKRQLVLEIDDAYAELGDPLKIIGLASCNRCADLRTRKQKLEMAIKSICERIIQMGGSERIGEQEKTAIQARLKELTQKYALMVADWHGLSGMTWDEEFVYLLVDKPANFGGILSHYWRTFRELNKSKIAA